MAAQFFPRVIRTDRCHPSFASAACEGRRKAVQFGEMWWSRELRGWVSSLNPLRSQTCEAVWRSGVSTRGLPYILEICPYCGSALPELGATRIDCGE
jgi:hypothetical protein